MRCKCCDWTTNAMQSDYHIGLQLSRRPKKLIETRDEIICDVCRDSDYDDDGDLFDPVEEMEKEE